MVKVAVYPPNSLVIADLIERKGHTALALQKEMRKKIKDPEIDSPPMNITEEDPIKGLKYAAIEVPSGVRGRMSIIGPIIDEAEAAILVDNAPYGFGCVGCQRTNELSIFCLRQRHIPTLELEYPTSRDETMDMVNKINTFLDNLAEPKEESEEKEQEKVETKTVPAVADTTPDVEPNELTEDESVVEAKEDKEVPAEERMKTEEERAVSKEDLVASLKSKGGY